MKTRDYDVWRRLPDGRSELVDTLQAKSGYDALALARKRGIQGSLWVDEDVEDDIPQPIRE